MSNTLSPGEELGIEQSLFSSNGMMELKMQGDGNLVLYLVIPNESRPVWSSETGGNPGATAIMQEDGHLVVHKAIVSPKGSLREVLGGKVLWSSPNIGRSGAILKVLDSGDLVIHDVLEEIWSTKTKMRVRNIIDIN